MLEKYKDCQSVFYNYINLSVSNNKVSHAYLIETNGVSYGLELAMSLAKFLICNGTYDSNVCNLIDSDNYFGFMAIGNEKEIKKEEILNLQRLFSLKSVDDRRMVYLIKDAALLNKFSANSLLKFLEEPSEGIVAILLCDNVDKVMSTISSRCQIISLVKEKKFDYKTIFDGYYEESFGEYEYFIKSEMDDFFQFYEQLEREGTDSLVFGNLYRFNNKFKYLLFFGLYLYFDVLNFMLKREKDNYLPSSDFIIKIVDNNEIDDIIRKIDVLNKFIRDINYNVNMNLFVDNFVISMGGK